MNAITSSIIGTLERDYRFSDWWNSEPVPIPFFQGQQLPVVFMEFNPKHDANFLTEADQALSHFLKLTTDDRAAIASLVFSHCMDFLDAVGIEEADEPMRQMKAANEVWKFIHPMQIYVQRRAYKDQDIYIQVACECDWEPEHGLQLVFRQGRKLTRISAQDGHLTEADAYNKPDEEDELLSKF